MNKKKATTENSTPDIIALGVTQRGGQVKTSARCAGSTKRHKKNPNGVIGEGQKEQKKKAGGYPPHRVQN